MLTIFCQPNFFVSTASLGDISLLENFSMLTSISCLSSGIAASAEENKLNLDSFGFSTLSIGFFLG